MIKYIFPQFKVEIVNPTISDVHVNDNISAKLCTISCMLIDSSGSKFGITVGPLKYDNTWTDEMVEEFIVNELEKFKV